MKTNRAIFGATLCACLVAACSGCQRGNSGIYDPDAALSAPRVATSEPTSEPAPVVVNAVLTFNEDATRLTIDSSEHAFVGFITAEDRERAKTVKVIRGSGLLTASGLASLGACRFLREFLWTDAVVEHDASGGFLIFETLRSLTKVRLAGLRTDHDAFPIDALRGLSRLPNLVDLDLSGSRVSSGDFGEIKWREGGFRKLKALNLYHTRFDDVGVARLLPLASHLESLNLDDAGITPSCVDSLVQFTNLTFLHVGRSELDDESVAKLAALTRLEKIHITRTRATEEGANRLRAALPNCTVVSQPEN